MHPTGHQASLERIEKLRRIYKEVSGEEISTEEATDMAHRFLALYRLLSQPVRSETEKLSPSPPPTAQSAPEEVRYCVRCAGLPQSACRAGWAAAIKVRRALILLVAPHNRSFAGLAASHSSARLSA